jgi:hypothetical protein
MSWASRSSYRLSRATKLNSSNQSISATTRTYLYPFNSLNAYGIAVAEEIKRRRGRQWAAKRRAFDRSFEGLVYRRYRDMKSRIKGAPQYEDLWKGLELISKEEFVKWSLNDPDYQKLHFNWVNSQWNRKLSPSIHRIDSSIGYVIGNMRWITNQQHTEIHSFKKGV